MQHKRFFRTFLAVAASLVAPAAGAHSAADGGGTFFGGIVHQLSGIDHVLAMLAIGMWAAQQGATSRATLPLAFFCSMLAGAGLALAGLGLPAVETGIATSVLVLGLFLGLAVRLPLGASLPLVIVFAMLHGNAHGFELAQVTSLPLYALGFVLTAAGLQLAGVELGARLASTRFPGLLRVSGLFMAGSSLVLWT